MFLTDFLRSVVGAVRERDAGQRQSVSNNKVNAKELSKMEREDFLLRQIDEIREKAQQLQAQLEYKSSHLSELEEAVGAKESKVRELESVLQYKKDEADAVVQTAGRQLQDVSSRIEKKLSELIVDVEETVGMSGRATEDQVKAVSDQVNRLMEALDDLKVEMGEKTHSESVKCFRNVQSSMDDLKDFIETKDISPKAIEEIQKPAKVAKTLGILNLILLIVVILGQYGVIDMLLKMAGL